MKHQELKQDILDSVREYAKLRFGGTAPFIPGETRINYGGRFFDEKEVVNLVDSALDFWLTAGPWAARFEENFAKKLGVKFCSVCNSGSSANLLAFSALTAHELGERRIRRGDEVITVADGFPTTVAPIIQFGAVPVFVDVTVPQYNIDVGRLEAAYSEKTKAVMIAHSLGNPFDIVKVKQFCERHNLWLVEDNCDALGSEVEIDGIMRKTGTIGDLGTSSFYPPHHLTMGEGGAVCTNNPLLRRLVNSFRDWGRDCHCPGGVDNSCGHRFTKQFGGLPAGYDHKYVYSHFGYNLKPTDLQAAIGCAQLEKLDFDDVRGTAPIKTATYKLGDTEVRVAVASGTKNARELLNKVKAGALEVDFIEIMACPGGCVNGGGQPVQSAAVKAAVDLKAKRASILYNADKNLPIRKSHENLAVQKIYDEYLEKPGSHLAHEILHTHYIKRGL